MMCVSTELLESTVNTTLQAEFCAERVNDLKLQFPVLYFSVLGCAVNVALTDVRYFMNCVKYFPIQAITVATVITVICKM